MKKGSNIRLHTDGRYEARYIKGRDEAGKIIYGYCYGKTEDEANEKRDFQLQKISKPKHMNLLILGAGSHGRDIYEIAKSLRVFSRIDFLDDDWTKNQAIGKWNEADFLLEDQQSSVKHSFSGVIYEKNKPFRYR